MVHVEGHYCLLWDSHKIRDCADLEEDGLWKLTGIWVRYLRKTLATSWGVKTSSFQLRSLPYCHFRRVGSQRRQHHGGALKTDSWRRLEFCLELFHPFVAAIYPKRALDLSRCVVHHPRNKGNQTRGR